MVGPAQQRQVGQVGGAAVQPVDQMVGLAPGRGSVAAGEHPAAVADQEGGALGGGHHPAGPADLQRLGRGATQCRGEQPRRHPQPGRQPLLVGGVAGGNALLVGGVAGRQRWLPLGSWDR
jgi:hypothetical protein